MSELTTDLKQNEELFAITDLIENYLLDNYPHIYSTTKRSEIKEWAIRYLNSK